MTAARLHLRRTEPGARTARILAAIERGEQAHTIARRFGCTAYNVWAIARRWGRVVAAGRRGKPRAGLAVTRKGLAAIRAYERAHGLPQAIGGA